ncbi:MAG: hypothetical protein K2P68_11530 [Sphingomonas sp.]|nr:hypothetical protein [Sphingomonas sp.]
MMMTYLLMLAQSTISPPSAASEPMTPAAGPSLLVKAKCPVIPAGEILVCADKARNEAYRLRPLPEKYAADRMARIKLAGGGSVTAKGEAGRLGDNQIMLTLRLPF